MIEFAARLRFVAIIVTISFTAIVACSPAKTTGPAEIHWDRQTCQRCQMVISERRHAVQVRKVGARRAHAFDDLGCALHWLDEQSLSTAATEVEVWVRESDSAPWIDARTRKFESGLATPMAYGFGVADQGVSLDEVLESVRSAERKRRASAVDVANKGDDQRG